MCSNVSIASTRMKGVDVLVVDRRGKGRLKPNHLLLGRLGRSDGLMDGMWKSCGIGVEDCL